MSAAVAGRARDKTSSPEAVVDGLRDGMTLVVGGAGLGRKPMALIEAIAASDLRDLRVVTFIGGPDVDVLVAAGKLREVVFGYVGFEAFGMAPNFRAARQAGSLALREWSEYMVIAALEAGARRLPFAPVRSGLATDVLRNDPELETLIAPYGGERVVAVPGIRPDVALIHVNAADTRGHGHIHGEPFVDLLAARAAERTFLSAERVAPAGELDPADATHVIAGPWVAGVVEIPGGAGFTSCYPDYRIDVAAVRSYLSAGGRRGEV